VGALVGLLTPVLIWPFFFLFSGLFENRLPEIILWSPVYMLISLLRIGWLTILLGIVLGVVIAYIQQKAKINF